ncbi:MAG: 30S ribosomal protein S17 [Candidatus Woesearchaeota archaeon]|jgi:small subunit ribosomal protein S17
METKNTDARNIGLDVVPPKKTCDDSHCAFHGTLPVRGYVFEGIVVSAKVPKTLTVSWERKVFIKKYERYMKKRTKVRVHCPPCFEVKEGDSIKIAECRPISKTKQFVVVEKIENKN